MAGHKFKPEKAGRLDGRLRRYLAPAEPIISAFGASSGETWAEIGAGTGYFVIPLSSRVEKVLALDLSEQMLELLNNNLRKAGIVNVESFLSGESSLPLEDESADVVLLAYVLHEVDEPERFLGEVARVTRSGGRLCIVDYTKSGIFGPPKQYRLTPSQINGMAARAGYVQGRTWTWQKSIAGIKFFENAGFEYRKSA